MFQWIFARMTKIPTSSAPSAMKFKVGYSTREGVRGMVPSADVDLGMAGTVFPALPSVHDCVCL